CPYKESSRQLTVSTDFSHPKRPKVIRKHKKYLEINICIYIYRNCRWRITELKFTTKQNAKINS
ncbi:MAG: hypothetical protein VYB03_01350, partial [Pseudomonadota bacterium]|nr:hypothetical protein [Pseudomonadota bacterium]